jgi:hypothetical protein
VNGDGRPDFAVGAPRWRNASDEEVGAVLLYAGATDWNQATPLWTAVSDQPLSQFGYTVRSPGDINQDGFADLVVGAWQYTHDQAAEGMIFIYLGAPPGPSTTPHWTAEGNKAETQFGFAIAPAGDVDQDGYPDLLVGAPEYRTQTELRGRAFLYLGRPADAPGYFTFFPLTQN